MARMDPADMSPSRAGVVRTIRFDYHRVATIRLARAVLRLVPETDRRWRFYSRAVDDALDENDKLKVPTKYGFLLLLYAASNAISGWVSNRLRGSLDNHVIKYIDLMLEYFPNDSSWPLIDAMMTRIEEMHRPGR